MDFSVDPCFMRNCDSELALSIKEFYFKELQLILSTHVVMSEKYKISIRRVSSGTIFRYIQWFFFGFWTLTQVFFSANSAKF